MTAFGVGVSGLQASNKNLETIGNNVANASTVGFKQSRVEFADVYAKGGLTTGSTQPGHGVRVADITQQFNGGGTTFTQNSLDMKIDGNGFFVVKENGQDIYTRAGMFGMDKDGFITTNAGNRVQGFPASTNGNDIEVGAIGDLYIPVANIEPNATTEVDVAFNLDSRETPPSNYTFDQNDSDTYTHLYPAVIYDSLGNSHTMTQYFVKQPPYLPDYGEQARGLEAMIGHTRYGSDFLTQTHGTANAELDAGGVFVGDADENPSATLDADIDAILTNANFTQSATPFAATAGADYDDPAATDTERGGQLKNLHDGLETLIGNTSGRTKEFYQSAYDALVEYLPGAATGQDSTVEVFEGALSAVESANLTGENIAYGQIDVIAGRARTAFMAAAPDTLTAKLDTANVNATVTAEQAEEIVQNMIGELNARITGNTAWTPTTTAGSTWGGTLDISADPSPEEQATYNLALNTLSELQVTYDDGTGVADPQAVIQTISALESESADNRWQMHAFVDGERVTDGNENSPDYFSFNFTEYGQMAEPLPKITIKDWTPRDDVLNPNGSSEPQDFTIDLAGTTQFAGAFGANTLSQDGFATGELSGLDVDKTGTLTARYTNGTQQLVGQVAIANFRNEQGLIPMGGTSWRSSSDSGDPVINEPGVGVAGDIQSNALEDSNVDLSQELVKMILAQRDYQANAKTIQTADTLTQTIINLR